MLRLKASKSKSVQYIAVQQMISVKNSLDSFLWLRSSNQSEPASIQSNVCVSIVSVTASVWSVPHAG